MNGRERFLETMRNGIPITSHTLRRASVRSLKVWRKQGLSAGTNLKALFHTDEKGGDKPGRGTSPQAKTLGDSSGTWKAFPCRLDPTDRSVIR
jgi:hypothetical protein